jgi:hypothetical protein
LVNGLSEQAHSSQLSDQLSGFSRPAGDCGIHLFDGNWLPALVSEHPLQLPHRAPRGHDGKLSAIDFDELQSIPGMKSESLANSQWNGDPAL